MYCPNPSEQSSRLLCRHKILTCLAPQCPSLEEQTSRQSQGLPLPPLSGPGSLSSALASITAAHITSCRWVRTTGIGKHGSLQTPRTQLELGLIGLAPGARQTTARLVRARAPRMELLQPLPSQICGHRKGSQARCLHPLPIRGFQVQLVWAIHISPRRFRASPRIFVGRTTATSPLTFGPVRHPRREAAALQGGTKERQTSS